MAEDGAESRGGGVAAVATGGLVLAAAAATWCLIGPLRETPRAGRDLDYRFRAPEVDRGVEWAGAVVALGLVVVFAVMAYRARAGRRTEALPLFVLAVGLAGAAGAVLGGSGRLMTAGSVGANIGGGIALLLGLPTALVLTVVAVVLATRWPRPTP